jgi:hypothetical protein
MKLTLKTVTGVNFSLDAEPSDTVREARRDPASLPTLLTAVAEVPRLRGLSQAGPELTRG